MAIPKTWVCCTVADITTTIETIERTDSSNREISYIDIGSINNRSNLIVEPKSLQLSQAPSRARQVVKTGDVLFATVRPYLRNIAQVPDNLDGQIASTGFSVLRAAPGVEPKYLFYKAISHPFVSALSGEQYGASYPAVRDEQVRAQPIELPPTREQRRIVAKIEELFSELDKGIEALATARQQLATYRKSILKYAFEGKLTEEWRNSFASKIKKPTALLEEIGFYKQTQVDGLREPEGMPTLPSTWAYVRAEDLCDFITKGTTPSKGLLHAGKGDIPFIKVYNLTFSGALDFSVDPTFIDENTHERLLTRSKVYPNDVLMNIVGPPLGKVSIVPNLFPEWNINQAIAIFRTAFLRPKLLAAYLAYEGTLRVTAKKAKATAGQFNLTLEICRDIPIPIFDPTEQQVLEQRLDSELSVFASLENDLEIQLTKCETLRQAVLSRAFSGQLVAQDATDEPASALLARIRAAREEFEPKKKRNVKNGKKNAA